jgi:hypothetical protein
MYVRQSAEQQAKARLAQLGVHSRTPVQAMQTYALRRPAGPKFWRPATCEQVDCEPHLRGWTTTVDERTELGQRQAWYIRSASARSYSEHRDDASLTVFSFAAGQRCFAADQHQVAVEREPLYVVRGGDYRRDLGVTRAHTRAEHWTEDFAENQDKIQTVRERG